MEMPSCFHRVALKKNLRNPAILMLAAAWKDAKVYGVNRLDDFTVLPDVG